MKTECALTVFGYADNNAGLGDEVDPMVHILCSGQSTGGVQSIDMPPVVARRLAVELLNAAREVDARRDYEHKFGWETEV
jgi:hypothetical protein